MTMVTNTYRRTHASHVKHCLLCRARTSLAEVEFCWSCRLRRAPEVAKVWRRHTDYLTAALRRAEARLKQLQKEEDEHGKILR